MNDLSKYKVRIIGKKIENLYFTKQRKLINDFSGVNQPYYFSTILELNDRTKFLFGNDYIIEWDGREEIILLTDENWNLQKDIVYRGQLITDISIEEFGQIKLHLENGITIEHTIDWGDQLFIE